MAMGSVTLKVDPEVLKSKSDAFLTKRNAIYDLLENAKKQVKTLPSTWNGNESEKLQDRFNQVYDDMSRVSDRIQEHVDDLRRIGEEFATAASQVAATIEKLPTDGVK